MTESHSLYGSEIDPELNTGESAIDFAPKLKLKNGQSCIPQHYLKYEHNRDSVEALIKNVYYSDRYPIFISDNDGGLILQIGIIGYDNYKSEERQKGKKIVFGRKWRIEPNLPSSEIIQTAFLAIKKAREHEIRELFSLRRSGKYATPFNNHQDLPLMARNHDLLKVSMSEDRSSEAQIKAAIEDVRFDGCKFKLVEYEMLRCGHTAITLSYTVSQEPPFRGESLTKFTFLLEQTGINALYHGLINALVSISDRHVDETFSYNGFKRFSTEVDSIAIADLSISTRQPPNETRAEEEADYGFKKRFATERYDTDLTRIPQLTKSPYSQDLYMHLSRLGLTNFDVFLKSQD